MYAAPTNMVIVEQPIFGNSMRNYRPCLFGLSCGRSQSAHCDVTIMMMPSPSQALSIKLETVAVIGSDVAYHKLNIGRYDCRPH